MKNILLHTLLAFYCVCFSSVILAGGPDAIKKHSAVEVTLESTDILTKKQFSKLVGVTRFSGKDDVAVEYWPFDAESVEMKNGKLLVGLIMVVHYGDSDENPVAIKIWSSLQLYLNEKASREKFVEGKESVTLLFLLDRFNSKCGEKEVSHCADYTIKIDVDNKTNAVTVNGVKYGVIE